MRGLTIRQPWADLVADGIKNIENRSRGFPTSYRGPVLIHAGAELSENGREDPRVLEAIRHRAPERPFLRSAALAVSQLVDVHDADECMGACGLWAEDDYIDVDGNFRQARHLVLETPLRFDEPTRDVGGALGLWAIEPDLYGEVLRRIARS